MDLEIVVQTLSSEIGLTQRGLPLEARDITQIDKNVTGARLFAGNKLYGAIALISDEEGDLTSCAYLGEYPGQTGVKLPVVGKRNQVSLELDTRRLPFSREDTPRLVRVDHNDVAFLGQVYDGCDAYEKEHSISKASLYARQLLEK